MKARRRRGAIVGFGFIAERGHTPAYRNSQELEIVAVADICAARRAAAARAFPDARIYADAPSLLVHEAAGLEFVDITTPPHAHSEIAHQALEAKLHVLCEKPLCVSGAQARALLGFAEHQKRVVFPSHNYRHAPVIRRIDQLLNENVIGPVHQATLETFRIGHARGVPEWNPDWRRQQGYSGGGIAMDHGSHSFYLAFHWLGAYPNALTAKTWCSGDFDTEDTLTAALSFPSGLVMAHLTWRAGVRRVQYTLHGTQGALRVEDDRIEIIVAAKSAGAPNVTKHEIVPSQWMDAGHSVWFAPVLSGFDAAIEARDYAGKDALDALACVSLIEACYASSNARSQELDFRVER